MMTNSKFAKFQELLKHELFKSERNPRTKMVVFSESVDTVEYLQRRINRSVVLGYFRKEQESTI